MVFQTSPEIGGMGHPIKRKEDLRFIQGKGNYVDDVQLPEMVYGHMVRSPYAHARLKSVNTEKAKQLPGVLAVITGEDLAKVKPCLDADPLLRQANGAGYRKGALSVAGSGLRGCGGSIHRRGRCRVGGSRL